MSVLTSHRMTSLDIFLRCFFSTKTLFLQIFWEKSFVFGNSSETKNSMKEFDFLLLYFNIDKILDLWRHTTVNKTAFSITTFRIINTQHKIFNTQENGRALMCWVLFMLSFIYAEFHFCWVWHLLLMLNVFSAESHN